MVKEPQAQYGLFAEAPNELKEGCKVVIQKEYGTQFKYHITKKRLKAILRARIKK